MSITLGLAVAARTIHHHLHFQTTMPLPQPTHRSSLFALRVPPSKLPDVLRQTPIHTSQHLPILRLSQAHNQKPRNRLPRPARITSSRTKVRRSASQVIVHFYACLGGLPDSLVDIPVYTLATVSSIQKKVSNLIQDRADVG